FNLTRSRPACSRISYLQNAGFRWAHAHSTKQDVRARRLRSQFDDAQHYKGVQRLFLKES
ncbi:MAG: hypothetical protein ACR2RB_06735, partial [Gammaproteobacteria bacterium]